MKSVDAQINRSLNYVRNNIQNAEMAIMEDLLREAKNYVNYFSPVDTWEYKKGHTTDPITREWDTLYSRLFAKNQSYAKSVEEWFKDKWWKEVTWHIDDRNVEYKSVGAEVYQKTRNALEQVVQEIVLENLDKLRW